MASIPLELQGKSICFVSPSAYPLLVPSAGGGWTGGAEAQLCTMGRKLSELGLDVHFIVGDWGQDDRVEVDGVTVHRATFRYMGGSNRYVLPDWWRIFRILRRIGADYHFIKVPRHLLFVMGIYSKLHGSKLIFVGQKDSDLEEQVIRSHEGALGWWLYRAGIQLTTTIIAQTEVQKKGFLKVFGKSSRVIRNVLTLEDDNAQDKRDYVLWVGNSTDDKQPQLVPQLARALPDVPFRMIMSKSHGREDDSYIRDQLPELPNLEYLGTVPFSQISEHYKQARVFISTSKCEGFPNTFLQAWQYRTPVISLLVDPDNVIRRYNLGRVSGVFDNMVIDIRTLQQDPALCEEIGENAHRYAYEYHSLESAVQGYCDLLTELATRQ